MPSRPDNPTPTTAHTAPTARWATTRGAVAGCGDDEWEAVATAIGLPSLTTAELFAPHDARKAHEDDRILQRSPMLGEHNEYALREIAGLSPQEFDELVVAGVIA